MVLVRVRVRATLATGGQVSGGGGQTRSVWAQPWEAAAFRAGLVRKTRRGPRRSRTLGTDGLGGAARSPRGSSASPPGARPVSGSTLVHGLSGTNTLPAGPSPPVLTPPTSGVACDPERLGSAIQARSQGQDRPAWLPEGRWGRRRGGCSRLCRRGAQVRGAHGALAPSPRSGGKEVAGHPTGLVSCHAARVVRVHAAACSLSGPGPGSPASAGSARPRPLPSLPWSPLPAPCWALLLCVRPGAVAVTGHAPLGPRLVPFPTFTPNRVTAARACPCPCPYREP